MKKLFLLSLALLASFSLCWGTATNFHDFVAAGDTIIDLEGTGAAPSAKFTAINNTDWASVSTSTKNNSIYRMDPATEVVATSTSNTYGTKLGSSTKSTYKVTGVSNVIFYVGTSSNGRIAKLDVTPSGESKISEAASVTLSTKANAYKMVYALDASKSYTLEAYASDDIFCYAVKFTVAAKCQSPANALVLSADKTSNIYVGDEITFSTTGGNDGAITIAGANSETITANKWIATVGEHTFTASQAKNGNYCAQEAELILNVAANTAVTSCTITGPTAAYKNQEVTYTATAANATSYRWKIDGAIQDGATTATFSYTPTKSGTYSIVCEARNKFNEEGEWKASSATKLTVTKLCGMLIKATTNDVVTGVVGGTYYTNNGTSDEKKLDKKTYYGVTLASGTFMAGDVFTVNVTAASTSTGHFMLYADNAGTDLIVDAGVNTSTGELTVTLPAAANGKNSIYLYRENNDNQWNPKFSWISVTRSCEESSDASFASLTVKGQTATKEGNVYSYEVGASDASTEVTVAYTLNHPLASATPTSGFTIDVPAAGDPANTATITVTAEDGTQVVYTVSVTKAAAASTDATLKALSVEGYTLSPAFDAEETSYTITKAYGAETPATSAVTATPNDANADAEVVLSADVYTITVTAEDDKTTKEYTITVNTADAPRSLSRVLFSNGCDAFIDNTNLTVKAYYLEGTDAPTATTITAGAGEASEIVDGKITVTGEDSKTCQYTVTVTAVTPNTSVVEEGAAAGTFTGTETWIKNGLLVYGNAAGFSNNENEKWYVLRRQLKGSDAADDQRVIAGWVRCYFFVGNASRFEFSQSDSGKNKGIKYAIDGGDYSSATTAESISIALEAGNHMIEIVTTQQSGDCRLNHPRLVKRTATAIDNTADETKAVKRIENGQLIIEKNGIRYNAQGQVIR